MRRTLLASLAALLASAAVAMAQYDSIYTGNPAPVRGQNGSAMSDNGQAIPGNWQGTNPYMQPQNQMATMQAQNQMATPPNSTCQGCTPGCEAACQSWRVHGWL